jgi:HAD superfamily hydrolase (TIGR01509 family)
MSVLSRVKGSRAVLFDLDGVLISSFRFWFHIFNKTLEEFGHRRITLATFKKHWGQSTKEDIRIFMPERTLPEVKAAFFRNMTGFGRFLKVNPEASAVLRRLEKNRFKLACVTNSHRRIALWQLRSAKLERFFNVLVTADDVKKAKPDPEMLICSCRKMRIRPACAVFIGDTRTDRQAAKKAGCVFIGYRMRSAYGCRSLKELSPLIRSIFQGKEEKC